MHRHFITEQRMQGLGLLHAASGLVVALNIGQGGLDLERVQRGVVPGVFGQGAFAFGCFGGGFSEGDDTAKTRRQLQQASLGKLGHQREHGVTVRTHGTSHRRRGTHDDVRYRRGQQGDAFFDDACGIGERLAKLNGGVERVEAHNAFEPRVSGCETGLHF